MQSIAIMSCNPLFCVCAYRCLFHSQKTKVIHENMISNLIFVPSLLLPFPVIWNMGETKKKKTEHPKWFRQVLLDLCTMSQESIPTGCLHMQGLSSRLVAQWWSDWSVVFPCNLFLCLLPSSCRSPIDRCSVCSCHDVLCVHSCHTQTECVCLFDTHKHICLLHLVT